MLLNLTPARKKTPISLTPLIDVVFILLLFFMLTSTFVAWRKIDTPISTQTSEPLVADEQPKLILQLKPDAAHVWVDGTPISLTDGRSFKNWVQQNNSALFILQADDQVTLQQLLNLADQLKLHGALQVSIANAFKQSSN